MAGLVFCRFAVLVGVRSCFPGLQRVGVVLQVAVGLLAGLGVVRADFVGPGFHGVGQLAGG
ncbi:hypothetical protein AB1I39_14935, partial [Chromobacterium vaccinii]